MLVEVGALVPQVVRPDDGGVAAGVAASEPALLEHRDVGDPVQGREVVGGREPVAAAAHDDDLVGLLGLGAAPCGRPALVMAERVAGKGEDGVSHRRSSLPLPAGGGGTVKDKGAPAPREVRSDPPASRTGARSMTMTIIIRRRSPPAKRPRACLTSESGAFCGLPPSPRPALPPGRRRGYRTARRTGLLSPAFRRRPHAGTRPAIAGRGDGTVCSPAVASSEWERRSPQADPRRPTGGVADGIRSWVLLGAIS